MEDIRRRKGNMKEGTSEGEKNHERLLNLRNKLRDLKGKGVGGLGEPGWGY